MYISRDCIGSISYYYLSYSQNGKTPLLCAAESGHDKVVAYLLTFEKVRTDLKNQPEKVESASVSFVQPFSPKTYVTDPGSARFTDTLDFSRILGCSRYDRSLVKASYCAIITDHLQKSPLLIAAQNGHTKCVTLLLQNGGNVLQRDSEDRNCLMIAIQNHHKYACLYDIISYIMLLLETDTQ